MDIKKLLPMLMMMQGGNANGDMLKAVSEMGKGGDSAQDLLPLFMNMFQSGQKRNTPSPRHGEETAARSGPSGDGRSGPSGEREEPKAAQFFDPILDFANEKIIYHLSLLLR